MAAARELLATALLGTGDDSIAAARRLVALSRREDTKVESIASLLELARCGAGLPAQLAVVALERLALSDDGMKVHIAAAGGVEVLFELLRNEDDLVKAQAADALVSLGPETDYVHEREHLYQLAIGTESGVDFWFYEFAINGFACRLCEHLLKCIREHGPKCLNLDASMEAIARVRKFSQTYAGAAWHECLSAGPFESDCFSMPTQWPMIPPPEWDDLPQFTEAPQELFGPQGRFRI